MWSMTAVPTCWSAAYWRTNLTMRRLGPLFGV
ncbi:transposase family protein [Streptomyces sp. NBC_01260]